jgi:hypothetical protein
MTFLLRNEANPGECLSVFQKATYADAAGCLRVHWMAWS